MKIVIITSEFPPKPGGIGNHAYSMAKAFVKKGYSITAISPAKFAEKLAVEKFDSEQDFETVRTPQGGVKAYWQQMKMAKNTVKNLLHNNEDLQVILTGKLSLWIGLYLRIIFRKKICLTCFLHGSEVNSSAFFQKKLTYLSVNVCDNLIAVSNFTASLLPASIKNKRKIEIIPNGIDLTMFGNFSAIKKIELKGSPKLLTVGSVTYRKGQHRIIKALPEIIKQYPNVHYHVVGLPKYKDEFEILAKDLCVERYITFHGKAETHTDLARFYKSSDVFMILSENQKDGDVEGFGIVVLEANYFGIPVVGAKGCGIADAIDSGYNGKLVDGNNSKEILEGISFCLENELSNNCKNWVEQHNWDNIINNVIKIVFKN